MADAKAEAGAGPTLFPFLVDGTTRRLGRHFANCVKLGEWELVSVSSLCRRQWIGLSVLFPCLDGVTLGSLVMDGARLSRLSSFGLEILCIARLAVL